MTLAVFSDRSDKLLWGVAAIAVVLVLSRILRAVVARLEARHPGEELSRYERRVLVR